MDIANGNETWYPKSPNGATAFLGVSLFSQLKEGSTKKRRHTQMEEERVYALGNLITGSSSDSDTGGRSRIHLKPSDLLSFFLGVMFCFLLQVLWHVGCVAF